MLDGRLANAFEEHEGVWIPRVDAPSGYETAWETAAAEDHVSAAIARAAPDETLEQLTAKTTAVWERIPQGRRVGTVLDVGCGYGRLALHLSSARDLRCDAYVGVDVSETMLRHALRYRERFGAFTDARFLLLRTSAHDLPMPDESVDLAVSSAVFLHMGKAYVSRALREIARVLKPDGDLVFEASFPNRWSPANLPILLRRVQADDDPQDVNLYSRPEVVRLIRRSGLEERVGRLKVEATAHALLPKAIGRRPLPLARRWNETVDRRRPGPDSVFAVSFTVSSL